MCGLLVSCADFKVIPTPFSEVLWNWYSSFLKNGKADHSIHCWPDVTPQIAFSSKGKVPNRNKNNSFTKPNKFHSKNVCFGGRTTREERKICLKIRLFGFPQTLVYRLAATAARKVVSPSTLIGPFVFERALTTRPSTEGKSSVVSYYRSPHSNQRLSFLRRKTYVNISEVNHKILNVNVAVIGYGYYRGVKT